MEHGVGVGDCFGDGLFVEQIEFGPRRREDVVALGEQKGDRRAPEDAAAAGDEDAHRLYC